MLDSPYSSWFGGPPHWEPGPLEIAPVSLEPPYTEPPPRWAAQDATDRANALAGALAGIELGAYDCVVLHWLTGWDNPTIASLIRRARLVAIAGAGMRRAPKAEQ